jgi:hypothetical protein
MAPVYSDELRNAGIDARIALIGPSAQLCIFDDACPKNTEAPDPETLLARFALPRVWMEKAEQGTATKKGTWSTKAVADGRARCFRLYDAKGKCHIQGRVPSEMTLDNPLLVEKQNVSVELFAIQAGNSGG